ncbi:unnamed protein product [Fusarium venenatum]|uniref:Uncharacterized protein n=1 Tax=Fusarium venenatum TaxID=56646 RepID=A0A2L2SN27_9HYPO|nr:uncharacterized protein FVRRES_11487 [Fusarium venenatum]CEI38796.1 unnamed protein product [Fusarium venenatum]
MQDLTDSLWVGCYTIAHYACLITAQAPERIGQILGLTLTALVLLSLQFSSVVMGFVGSEQGHRQFWIVTSMQNMSSINGTKHADIYSELQQTDNLFGNPSAIISDPTMTARS